MEEDQARLFFWAEGLKGWRRRVGAPGGGALDANLLFSGALPAVSSLCFQSDASRRGSSRVIDAAFVNNVRIHDVHRCRRSLRKSLTQRVFADTSHKAPNFCVDVKTAFCDRCHGKARE